MVDALLEYFHLHLPELALRRVLLIVLLMDACLAASGAGAASIRPEPIGVRQGAAPEEFGLQSLNVSVERQVRRWVTRTERLSARLLDAAQGIGVVLLWLMVSTGIFASVATAAALADPRVLRDLRRDWRKGTEELFLAGRVLWKASLDRALPLAPRFVVLAAWAYWLLPADLLGGEELWWLAWADDSLVAIGAGRLFVYLCPSEVLERNARG
ncbi:MAG: hypothetical protein KatS3mg077_0780 [Candidatus Binatia bacterium]|nr:MAG: hypothetical protein KatS3mg077_0780 [Candidatus Binatia bacterium]